MISNGPGGSTSRAFALNVHQIVGSVYLLHSERGALRRADVARTAQDGFETHDALFGKCFRRARGDERHWNSLADKAASSILMLPEVMSEVRCHITLLY